MSDEHPKLTALRQAFHEVEQDRRAAGIRITIGRALSFFDSSVSYSLRIERERYTASGNLGKPELILNLINNPDESPADMLRILADLLTQDADRTTT
jgi:hypothetical protein